MTIVRELLIKIGFIQDKKTQVAVNKTIEKTKKNLKETGKESEKIQKTTEKSDKSFLSFGRKLFLRTAFYTYAIKKYIDLLNKFVTASLDQRDLAKSLSLSNEHLNAFTKTAEQFRFKPEDSIKALALLNDELKQARNGANSLQRLRNIFPRINLDKNENAIENFRRILVFLSNISDENSRIEKAGEAFPGAGVPISNMAKEIDQFDKLFFEFSQRKLFTEQDEKNLEKFEKAVIDLKNAFSDFFRDLAVKIVPIIDLITFLLKVYNKEQELERSIWQKIKDAYNGLDPVADYILGTANANNVSVSNTFNLPAGTPEEQAKSMSNLITGSVKDFFDPWLNIQNNNTRTE